MNNVIGTGQQGFVYLGQNKNKPEQKFAVKIIEMDKSDRIKLQTIVNELKVMEKFDSPYIVKLISKFKSNNNMYIIMEYCEQGNLQSYLNNCPQIPEEQILKFLAQIIQGYQQLVQKNVIHRDLKPENIFLHNNKALIGDFGLAHLLQTENGGTRLDKYMTVAGSPNYRSPQLLYENEEKIVYANNKCDVWSLGVISYEASQKQKPWTGNTIQELKQNIKTKQLQFKRPISLEFKRLIQSMLQYREDKRISWEQLYKNELIQQYMQSP
ncbi:Protein kinase-like domain [Pseudocohnilembus persalinus]|uniref:Protein kinase-like domain n=1 Tax=Pseudocohnilembus persalinus TaxID=266149 RepID=A0A0V0QPD0_PSEPJ|nr:Protein kinase-like domain [Pseudocohnilembus persalinus]|eukprot:KRX04158.1 Protein kinase-like domain [Pseudocohnilembus persalinus]